jgi:hypothetical protein
MVLLERVEADDRADQHRQGVEAFRGAFVADPQPPEATKPSPGPFDRPAATAKPLGGLDLRRAMRGRMPRRRR